MRLSDKKRLVVAVIAVLATSAAHAQQPVLTADTQINSAATANNYGGSTSIIVSSTDSALLQFNVADIVPSGTTADQVLKARLIIFNDVVTTGGTVSLYQITSSWSENSVTYATKPSIASTAATSASIGAAHVFHEYTITSLVQTWITTPSSNYGVELKASGSTNISLDSKENTTTSHPAVLEIVLSGPAGPKGATGSQGPAGGGLASVSHNSSLAGNGTSGSPLGVAVPLAVSGSAYGVIQGTDTGSGEGILGSSASGVGVFGEAGGSGGIGVEANSSNYIGLEANGYTVGVSSTAATYGVMASALANTGTTTGLYATGYNGVEAISTRATGNGILTYANNGNPGDYAVYAVSDAGQAGYFAGNVTVTGTLVKPGGSFKIDHPLDPENKYLSHSFVESPDMMNIYNGNVVTDSSGNAVVTMPDWFEALNRDFRYQLTVIGQFAQAIIASEMANRTFAIKTDKPNVKVSWMVTGIRHDAWADAHRIPVEQEKPEKERGTYLHPELFEQPEEKGVEWAIHPETMASIKNGRRPK